MNVNMVAVPLVLDVLPNGATVIAVRRFENPWKVDGVLLAVRGDAGALDRVEYVTWLYYGDTESVHTGEGRYFSSLSAAAADFDSRR